ncbi:hypothetical protein HZA38_04315 [Candidatus Peregrinibacteria bacterium]|nr:hypothetical protein [Candidatus Peregrinibacteria bacterium]
MDIADKIQLRISYIIRVALLIAFFFAIFTGHWLNIFLAGTAFYFSFLPAIIEKNYKVSLPTELEFLCVIFIFCSLYLGEIQDYYVRFWWWDIVVHGSSGVLLGILGFLLVYILNKEKSTRIHMDTIFIGIFSFVFAVAIGALWEIFEFGVDNIFGANMQRASLEDTMWDLILDSLGAFLASLGGYYYLKGGENHFFNRIFRKFIEKNPKIFDPEMWKKWRKDLWEKKIRLQKRR